MHRGERLAGRREVEDVDSEVFCQDCHEFMNRYCFAPGTVKVSTVRVNRSGIVIKSPVDSKSSYFSSPRSSTSTTEYVRELVSRLT
jgi:hypothetical protein